MLLLPYLQRVVARENLSASDAREAMLAILSGGSSTAQIASFLVALRMKGETPDELLGFARAIRENVETSVKLRSPSLRKSSMYCSLK